MAKVKLESAGGGQFDNVFLDPPVGRAEDYFRQVEPLTAQEIEAALRGGKERRSGNYIDANRTPNNASAETQ